MRVKEFSYISIWILLSIILGVLFASLLDIELTVDPPDIGKKEIFFNNAMIGIILVLLTSLVAYPIILFNGFFLGLNIFFGFQLLGGYKTFMLLAFHTPLEILGWIICIIASKRMFVLYKQFLKRKSFKKNLLTISKLIVIMVAIYLGAAFLEYYVFEYMEERNG